MGMRVHACRGPVGSKVACRDAAQLRGTECLISHLPVWRSTTHSAFRLGPGTCGDSWSVYNCVTTRVDQEIEARCIKLPKSRDNREVGTQ
jgi:hypothetical protein